MGLQPRRRGRMTGIPTEPEIHVDPSGAAAFEGSADHPMRDKGREAGAKAKGVMQVEGKEYIVADGDVIFFRTSA